MKNPSILNGIVTAIVITLASIPVTIVLQPAVSFGVAFKLTVLAASVVYLAYMVNNRRGRAGNVTLLGLLLIVLVIAGMVNIGLASTIVLATGSIWLLRSWLFHRSLIAVAADFVLCLTSLGGALWAFHYGGGYFGALWCFFLIQALFVLIAGVGGSKSLSEAGGSDGSRFERARYTAEVALERILSKSANGFDAG